VSGGTVVVGDATARGAAVDDGETVVVVVVADVVVDATPVDFSAPAEPCVEYDQ